MPGERLPLTFSSSLLLSSARLFFQTPCNSTLLSPVTSHKQGSFQPQRGQRHSIRRGSHWFASQETSIDPRAGPELLPVAPDTLPPDSVAVVWLRNDLRIRDHAAFALANTAEAMAPLFVFDMTQFGKRNKSPWGFQRVGPFRAAFLVESVDVLTKELRRRGTDMYVRHGEPVEEVLSLVRDLAEALKQPVVVVAHKETAWEEVRDEKAVEEGLRKLSEELDIPMDIHWLWTSTVHHPNDLPFNPAGAAVPRTFSEYSTLVRGQDGIQVREEIEMPERFRIFPLSLKLRNDGLPTLGTDLGVEGLADPLDYAFPHPLAVHDFDGGFIEGEDRIEEYIWRWKGLEEYQETRTESGRHNSSTKLSPWLALGCISPRCLYSNVKRFEEKNGSTDAVNTILGELIARDYFKWVSASVGRKLFALNGYSGPESDSRIRWKLKPGVLTSEYRERFNKWMDGKTGAPFIDANMRELKSTGFMSNQGRQNVASFLIHDLEFPDWRAGAEYFESHLIDYDVASNWTNWASLAGVGNEARGGNKLNVIEQSMRYEGDGWFLTRWCPELLHVPPPMIHEPHVLSVEDFEFFDLKEGDYPRPIVPLPEAPTEVSEPLEGYEVERSMEWAERVRADFIEAGAEEVTRMS